MLLQKNDGFDYVELTLQYNKCPRFKFCFPFHDDEFIRRDMPPGGVFTHHENLSSNWKTPCSKISNRLLAESHMTGEMLGQNPRNSYFFSPENVSSPLLQYKVLSQINPSYDEPGSAAARIFPDSASSPYVQVPIPAYFPKNQIPHQSPLRPQHKTFMLPVGNARPAGGRD